MAAGAGTISQVQTLLSVCPASISISTCATESSPDGVGGAVNPDQVVAFTAAKLPQSGSGQCGGTNQPSCAVNVAAGQTVNVSVTITFQ
ncbi:MAG: hypothetical protein WAL73_13025 [Terracidiphilus sp.]